MTAQPCGNDKPERVAGRALELRAIAIAFPADPPGVQGRRRGPRGAGRPLARQGPDPPQGRWGGVPYPSPPGMCCIVPSEFHSRHHRPINPPCAPWVVTYNPQRTGFPVRVPPEKAIGRFRFQGPSERCIHCQLRLRRARAPCSFTCQRPGVAFQRQAAHPGPPPPAPRTPPVRP